MNVNPFEMESIGIFRIDIFKEDNGNDAEIEYLDRAIILFRDRNMFS